MTATTPDTRDTKPGISAAIVVKDGHVLMVRRRIQEGTLSWQFPAGAVEPGETAEEAAIRETLEETGVTVKAVTLLGEREHPITGRHMSYVVCSVGSGLAQVGDPEELAEVAWCDHRQLAENVPVGIWEPVQAYLDAALVR